MFERKLKRKFTLDCLNQFGTELEDVKLILGNQQSNLRKLSDKKRQQFNQLYMRALEDMVTGESELRGILFTKIDVPILMQNIKVYWRCTGDVQRDQEIEELLDKYGEILRKRITELFYHTPVPPLVFLQDRQHLHQQELNKLFEIADYGMQYRAVSPVGAVLGSSKDTGVHLNDPNDPKVSKERIPPRWLDQWRRRTKAAERKEEQ
uniref:Uncharacterized protein n=1 Tax=Globodera rostochiensis TaxID=31243 RepID=A0A914HF69_GLORO